MSLVTFIFFLEIPLLLRIMSQEGNKYAIRVKKYSIYISMGILALDTFLLLPKYYISISSLCRSIVHGLGIVAVFLYIVYSFIGMKDVSPKVIKNNINNPKVSIRLRKLHMLTNPTYVKDNRRRLIMSKNNENPSEHMININNNKINSLINKEPYKLVHNPLRSVDSNLVKVLANSDASSVSSVAASIASSSDSAPSSSMASSSSVSDLADLKHDDHSDNNQNDNSQKHSQTDNDEKIKLLNNVNNELSHILRDINILLLIIIIVFIVKVLVYFL